jgi:hypothetical protein
MEYGVWKGSIGLFGTYALKVWNKFWIVMSCIQGIMVVLFNVSIDSGGV